MAIVAPDRALIQEEDVQYRASVSEAVGFKIGAMVNHIATKQYDEKTFPLNGRYDLAGTFPAVGVDGLSFVQFDAEIIGVWVYNQVAGSSGTTELDVQIATSPGGSFSSIFSTTPKITSAAPSNSYADSAGVVTPPTGVTAPVLSVTQLNAGTAIRVNLVSAMAFAESCGIVIHYRPR